MHVPAPHNECAQLPKNGVKYRLFTMQIEKYIKKLTVIQIGNVISNIIIHRSRNQKKIKEC